MEVENNDEDLGLIRLYFLPSFFLHGYYVNIVMIL